LVRGSDSGQGGIVVKSLEGQALVASPYLQDPNFLRSVVFILRHSDEGAYGLIVNRPTPITVGDLLEHVLERHFENDSPIYCGGPVEGPIVVLHEREDCADIKCLLDVYLATDQKKLTEVCEHPDGNYRVFDGYAGWGPNQLEEELKRGGWLVWQPTRDELFSDSEQVWQHAVRQIGRDILAQGIDPHLIPDDPANN